MQPLSKEAEQKITAALNDVIDLVGGGMRPTDAMAKVAAARQIPAGHVPVMANAYNIGRSEAQRKGSAELTEKAGEFELADASAVLDRMFPAAVKAAGVLAAEGVVSAEYAAPPRFLADRAGREKRAAAGAIDWAMVKAPPAPLPADPHRAVKKAYAKLVGHRRAFEDSIAMLEASAAEGERVRRWVQHLGDVRAVLHRDSLPKVVAQHYLRELEIDTNAFLGVFDAPFRVETDAGLSFRALFHDGRDQPAGRLSGGEKVVLALAFRLSVNSMFAQDVGLLCLDEPTVGLDDHNLGCLRTALGRLKELSRARGLQVILVTHERSLGPLFDQVIDLSTVA